MSLSKFTRNPRFLRLSFQQQESSIFALNIFYEKCRPFSTSAKNPRIVRSTLPDVPMPKTHLFDLAWTKENLGYYANHAATTDGITGKSYTYHEAYTLSKKICVALSELGLSKGDALCMVLPNCPEFPCIVTGASARGITVSTANPAYTAGELSRQFTMSGSRLVVTNSMLMPNVTAGLEKNKDSTSKVIVLDATNHQSDNILSFQKLVDGIDAGNFDSASTMQDYNYKNDPMLLPFSSGTTGIPKGVVLTHENINCNMRQSVYAKDMTFVQMPDGDSRATTVCVLPMFHCFGLLVTCFPTLFVSGHIVTLPNFDPATFLKALVEHKPRLLHFAPPLLAFCANHPMVKEEHLESVEFIMVAAAPLGRALIDKFMKKFPNIKLREGYGMTELSPVATFTSLDKLVYGSCGITIPNTELKIADLNTGEPLGPNQRGELCVRGPQVMKEYLNNAEATQNTIKDNWLHTGDIAYYNEEEYFFIVDRLKELIKVKGFQVPPAELENILRSHPKVEDVAVIGVPDERAGEVPRAYLVVKESMTEEEVHTFINAEVSEHKRLKGGVEFVEAIKKNPSGKILRKDILAQYLEAIKK